MNTAHHGRAPDDSTPDPTGMREILASLPDPGPMPDSVAARIQQSLSDERAEAAQGAWTDNRAVSDLAVERQRRRPSQWIMAAAAVIAVGVIGTVVFDQVLGSSSGDAAAQYAPTNEDSNEAGSGGESGSAEAGEAPEGNALESQNGSEGAVGDSLDEDSAVDDGGAPDGSSGAGSDSAEAAPLEESRSLIQDIDDTDFAAGAMVLLRDDDAAPSRLPGEFTGSGPAEPMPSDDVDNCVQAAGEDPDDGQWAATPATINGSDVVLLGDLTPQESRAWALDQGCADDDGASVLNGPVDLP